MLRFTPERLCTVTSRVLKAAGARASSAECVAASLVENNLMGHESHGVLRISQYTNEIANGIIDPAGIIRTLRESATTALLDGGRNFGQIVAHQAMEMAIERARRHDLGLVAIRNCSHTGRLGEYACQAAREGLIGLVFSAGSSPGGIVAPYGATSRALNTNPMSWAVPTAKCPILFLDMATSMVAQGKIVAAIDNQRQIPPGWLLNAAGEPTTNPLDQREGGALVPFGLHKGSGLSVMIDLVAGGLTGRGPAILPEFQRDYPTVVAALNIEAFQPLDEFRETADKYIAALKQARKAPGVEEIFVPGEIEWRTRQDRLQHGIEIPEATWERIVSAGAKLGLDIQLQEEVGL
ncbi:MAG: Ldh family oxidoreductase [Chloroflexi bacterium]|nr:Ldh family oxidoreductase [Chloroflexota bacterium]